MLANDSDPDGDTLTLSSATSNGGVSISVSSPSAGYVAIGTGPTTGNFTGSYVVTDGHAHNVTGAINVTVTHGGPGGPGGC